MPSDEGRRRQIVLEWVKKAENDLINAEHTLKLGKECPTDTVCFHAQQCAEKYLKALLALHADEVPKTHDIRMLLTLTQPYLPPVLAVDEQRDLTLYAVVTRYPEWDEPSLSATRKAVRCARRVRMAVRKLLRRWAEQQKIDDLFGTIN